MQAKPGIGQNWFDWQRTAFIDETVVVGDLQIDSPMVTPWGPDLLSTVAEARIQSQLDSKEQMRQEILDKLAIQGYMHKTTSSCVGDVDHLSCALIAHPRSSQAVRNRLSNGDTLNLTRTEPDINRLKWDSTMEKGV